MPLKLIVMGTGDFAVPTLRELLRSRHSVRTLVTQVPRVAPGRIEPPMPQVKRIALEHGIEVLEPDNVNAPEAIEELRRRGPDLFVVAAYGQILSDALLSVPRLGGINLHGSLLPKYRGAAPVSWAIYHGETETGVTVIQMQPRVDAGPILAAERAPIHPDETAGELSARLAAIGAPLVLRVIDELETGTIHPVPQDPTQATRARRLRKSDGRIDWSRSAVQIANQVRAMQPWPTAYTFWHRRDAPEPLRLIILKARPGQSSSPGLRLGGSPGTVLVAEGDRLEVQADEEVVAIIELQPSGKRAMTASEFLRGHPIKPGDQFVSPPGAED